MFVETKQNTMNLTGQAKADFEKWYQDNVSNMHDCHAPSFLLFHDIPDSMKWGVLLDFFKEKGYWVNTDISPITGNFEFFIHKLNPTLDDAVKQRMAKLIYESTGYDFLENERAQKAAIKQACIIYNEMKGKQ